MRARLLVGGVLTVALLAAAGAYVTWRIPSRAATSALDLTRHDTFLYVDENGHTVGQATRAAPGRGIATGPRCLRAHAAGGTMVCLRAVAVPAGFEAAILNPDGTARRTINLWGTPSRARVSPSGRLVAWTVFRTGDSYLAAGAFSTTAGIYDTRTGTLHGSLEDFTAVLDGKPVTAVDVNYWGITFAADDRTFYATMAFGGRTWLVRGDPGTRRLEAIAENAECPSLSPDGTRAAYKKRVSGQWRLHVRDLATGRETSLAEPAAVDDQAAWLDNGTVAYAKPVEGKPAIHAVPADGTGGPTLLRRAASSPVPLPAPIR